MTTQIKGRVTQVIGAVVDGYIPTVVFGHALEPDVVTVTILPPGRMKTSHLPRLAVEIRLFDFRARQTSFVQIVLGEQVGVLQAQAFFHASAVGVGFDSDRCRALCVDQIP